MINYMIWPKRLLILFARVQYLVSHTQEILVHLAVKVTMVLRGTLNLIILILIRWTDYKILIHQDKIKFIPHRLERVDMVQVILIPQPEWVDMVVGVGTNMAALCCGGHRTLGHQTHNGHLVCLQPIWDKQMAAIETFCTHSIKTFCTQSIVPSSSSVLVNTKQQEVKSQAASLGDDKNNNNKSFVVVDLKSTCWDSDENKDRRLRQEIVEFSSVLVDAATGHTKSTFHKYVIPTENHVLSEYCKNYNGIEQEAVERRNGAVMLSEALHLQQEWIGKPTNWNAVVVTWGNWDCRTMLKQECSHKKLPIPDYFAQWINLKRPFADKYGNGYWSKSVKEALEATEVLEWEGRDALLDETLLLSP
ncbi:uncharacterized protein [Miscanthus floridulus]|uniref:uncharacterized protein n=1 Tax=Miscanthus floridulus TaxID=154761 RepID=UPI0034587950